MRQSSSGGELNAIVADSSTPSAPSTTSASNQVRADYKVFLEMFKHSSAQSVVNLVREFVLKFSANLSRQLAARKIHEFLADATERLLRTEVFANSNIEDINVQAAEFLEKFVVLKLHKVLFRHDPNDFAEDERIEQGLQQPGLDVLPFEGDLKNLDQAVTELRKIDQYRAPRDKSVCMMNAVGMVLEELKIRGYDISLEEKVNIDIFLQVLTAVVARAAPQNFFSNVQFTSHFRDPARMSGEERLILQQFQIILERIAESQEPVRPLGNLKGVSASDLSPWLASAGVTFRYENKSTDDLLLGEVDELLEDYQRMAKLLRELQHKLADASS